MMGNVRTINYPAPELLGAGAALNDVWLARNGETGHLIMPRDATGVRLYFAFSHETLLPQDLSFNKVSFSDNANSFGGTLQEQLQILDTPRNERGFYGNIVAYTHYIDIDPATKFDLNQEQWYFRVYVQDDQNPVTEIPTDNGIYYIKTYMSFRWAE
jgi:hypothetical protein